MCPSEGGGNGRHSEYCSGKSKFRKIFASRYTYLLHRPQLFSCLGREAGGQRCIAEKRRHLLASFQNPSQEFLQSVTPLRGQTRCRKVHPRDTGYGIRGFATGIYQRDPQVLTNGALRRDTGGGHTSGISFDEVT